MVKFMDGLSRLVKILISLFLGILWPIYRIVKAIEKGKMKALVGGILSLIFFPLFWIIDFVSVIIWNKIVVLA